MRMSPIDVEMHTTSAKTPLRDFFADGDRTYVQMRENYAGQNM
jgi:hypothetical protein